MLELKGLSKHFGGVRAVDSLDLRVTQGEVFGLIGPNGSGKSTVVNLVCGLFPVTAGQVLLRNEDITSLASHVRVACGVTRTFQNIRLFGQLSVWQNLWVAQNAVEHRSEGFLRRWLGGPGRAREEIDRILETGCSPPNKQLRDPAVIEIFFDRDVGGACGKHDGSRRAQ